MAPRRQTPTQRNLQTPLSQGLVPGGNMPGLAGDAGFEIGRIAANIDSIQNRLEQLETSQREHDRFVERFKGIAIVSGVLISAVIAILLFFFAETATTLKKMAEREQVRIENEASEERKALISIERVDGDKNK